jgi:hypothetical protein
MNNHIADDIKNFENQIRKRYLIPEAIVIDCKAIGYPFYVLTVDLTYLTNRQLELLEEFVMKGISYKLKNQQEISCFLGIDEQLINKIVSELLSKGLIKKEDVLKLTELGSDALEKQTVLAPISETKTFYIDALSGKLRDSFYLKFFESNNNEYVLSKIVKKPRKSHIEDIVDYYEHIEKLLQNSSNSNRIELIQVNAIEKIYTQWHELFLVLYQRDPDDKELEYEIFSRGNIQDDYKKTLEQLYAEGKKILAPIFQELEQDKVDDDKLAESTFLIDNEEIKIVEKLRLKLHSLDENNSDSLVNLNNKSIKEERKIINKELEQIKTQSKISEIIHTYEHRDYLFNAFKEAKERVMIVSPWIKSYAVDGQFFEVLEATLKKKIQVYIFYGIKHSSQQNDMRSIKKLEDLSDIYQNFSFKRVKNTHRKIIVCDNKFGIVTSFNFLSFRADPNLTYRDELGVIIRDTATIENLFNSGINLTKENV